MQTILIVDDDNTIRAMLELALGREYDVIGTNTGEDLEKLLEDRAPDLLLLDINLPGADGYDVCEKIRSRAKSRNLPIVFMTVQSGDAAFLKSLAVGGDSFITKPFKMADLRKRIQSLLPRS
jgi:DNA-binding response OmpR family regulator